MHFENSPKKTLWVYWTGWVLCANEFTDCASLFTRSCWKKKYARIFSCLQPGLPINDFQIYFSLKKKIIKHFLSVYGCLRQIIFEEKGRTITVSTYYVGFLKRIEVNFREERFTNSSFVNILLFASFIKRIITRAAGRNTSRFVWSKVIFSKFCRNLKISVFLTINQIVLSDG